MIADRTYLLDPSIFRTYDIRGIVGNTLTEETVYLIGKAIGSLVRDSNENQVTVARDGRLSGPVLMRALSQGLLSTGCKVIDIGVVPTPVLYYASQAFGDQSGVMLTGSHNPPGYNGLKIVIKGNTLAGDEIKDLYQRILEERFYNGNSILQEQCIVERYIDDITHNVQLTRPLKVVVDGGNGVASELAPRLYEALGCEVHEIFCQVDGHFPNHHPDPSQVENLQDLIREVVDRKADIGLAFDGDGDRLGVVTSKGNIIWPDRLLMLFAKTILEERDNPQEKTNIVYDVKCSHHLDKLISSHGGNPIMWKTGHSLIKSKLVETNAVLAGEMSGHFFFKDRWYGFDDALYAGARLLEIIAKQTLDSDTLFASIPNSVNTPELKVLVTEEEKIKLMSDLSNNVNMSEAQEVITIDGLRINFAEGWGLVRPSNTTPYLILRFEALSHVALVKIQDIFRQWMLSVKPDLVLPF